MKHEDDIIRAVRRVLLATWDPIGIRDVPQAQDEYDSYAPEIAEMIASNTAVEKLADRLLEIETGLMGLRGNREQASTAALALTQLKSS